MTCPHSNLHNDTHQFKPVVRSFSDISSLPVIMISNSLTSRLISH